MPLEVVSPPVDLPTLRAPVSPAALGFEPDADPTAELERQVQTYVELGLPDLLALSEAAFRAALAPLRTVVDEVASHEAAGPEDDRVPLVLVLPSLAPNDVVPAMRRGHRAGVSVIDSDEVATFHAIDGVELPAGFAYLAGGIDVGSTYVNVTPEAALTSITAAGRTPLTIAEGLALVTVRPDMLRPNRCFSLAGSRTGTNQRVPAIWISDRRPKLGWCWDRNPHTWLGTASASARRGAVEPAA